VAWRAAANMKLRERRSLTPEPWEKTLRMPENILQSAPADLTFAAGASGWRTPIGFSIAT
jgi:hypothetical protein